MFRVWRVEWAPNCTWTAFVTKDSEEIVTPFDLRWTKLDAQFCGETDDPDEAQRCFEFWRDVGGYHSPPLQWSERRWWEAVIH